MNLERALKNAVYTKLNGTTFDSNIGSRLYYLKCPSPPDPASDYPHCIYNFNPIPTEVEMGDVVPVLARLDLWFHIFSVSDVATEAENLLEDLTDVFFANATLDVQSQLGAADYDWQNPSMVKKYVKLASNENDEIQLDVRFGSATGR